MKNHVSKEIALSVLKAIFSARDVIRLSKMRGIIMCGYPGCGKSTIARLLGDAFKFERLSTDQIRMDELFKGQEHRQASEHERVMISRYMVYEELSKRVNKKLNNSHRVVIDGTNLDSKRWSILGGMLTKVPQNRVAIVMLRTPEWIVKKRFMNVSKEKHDQWWSVYDYWKKYVKQGKAKFPIQKELPRVKIIRPKRYAIKTFEWVTDIKAILWDVDGTLYKDTKELRETFDRPCIKAFGKARGLSKKKAEKEFWRTYKKLGSKTKTLELAGIDAKKFVKDLVAEIEFDKFLRSDNKMVKTIKSLKHLKHFVLSNAGRKETVKKLKVIGIPLKLFEEIMVTYEFAHIKPDPKAFSTAVRKMKLKPNQVLTIGDREKTDIIPAEKAGLRTCMVWGNCQYADVSLKAVYEVAELFGKEI